MQRNGAGAPYIYTAPSLSIAMFWYLPAEICGSTALAFAIHRNNSRRMMEVGFMSSLLLMMNGRRHERLWRNPKPFCKEVQRALSKVSEYDTSLIAREAQRKTPDGLHASGVFGLLKQLSRILAFQRLESCAASVKSSCTACESSSQGRCKAQRRMQPMQLRGNLTESASSCLDRC